MSGQEVTAVEDTDSVCAFVRLKVVEELDETNLVVNLQLRSGSHLGLKIVVNQWVSIRAFST